MKRCKVTLENIPGSPYSASRMYDEERNDRESWDDFDKRMWREHCTTNEEGQVCIPSMGWKQCIDTASFKLGLKIAGRRGATFRSFFSSGFFCEADVPIFFNGKPLTKQDAHMVIISANADGKRGSGKRVPRRFPMFDRWQADALFTITDDIITKEIYEQHVRAAGIVCGVGRFRPENGGTNGRFRCIKFEWEDIKL